MTGLASTVYGVDFGAGEHDAGEKTWLARGEVDGDRLRVVACETVASAFDGGPRRRVDALSALADFLSGARTWDAGPSDVYAVDADTAVGLDFSFGLPAAVLGEDCRPWTAFLSAFPRGLPSTEDWDGNEVDGPEALTAWGSQRAREVGADCVHCKRETDAAVGAQPPYGIVGKYITYHGIASVLREVQDDVTVAPMETDERSLVRDGPVVLEAYPAGTLDRLGLHRRGYKGAGGEETRRRGLNVDGLVADVDGVEITDAVAAAARENEGGDALDAVVAAVATYRATRSADTLAPDEAHYDDREGYIYV